MHNFIESFEITIILSYVVNIFLLCALLAIDLVHIIIPITGIFFTATCHIIKIGFTETVHVHPL